MAQSDWFEHWFESPYYQILYQNRDEAEAGNFSDTLLSFLQPPPEARMLDIACGEGRFAVQLAARGYDVTGIDLSHNAIEKAKAYEHDRLHFFIHDMRLPFYINYFDYAFNFFTSFGYFKHDRDNISAAKSFSKALKPGGTLVIDYLNTPHVLNHLVSRETITRGSYTFDIERRLERGRFIKDIRFTDSDGNSRHYTEQVSAFTHTDFERIFEAAGMVIAHTFGDYKLADYDPGSSPRMILLLKKQHA